MLKLIDAVRSAQSKLDDEDGEVWTPDELKLYAIDGCNIYCRRTRCLFDIHVIENVPPSGNWTTDLERYMMEQRPGFGITNERLHFTADAERDLTLGGAVGESREGPVALTTSGRYADTLGDGEEAFESESVDAAEVFSLPAKVDTSRLSNDVVEVWRVTYDEQELQPEGSAEIRKLDNQYERRDEGDPKFYTMDKDGLMRIRLIPPAKGDAVYAINHGFWGNMSQTSNTEIETVGTWGLFLGNDKAFPSGGPWGLVTRQHPAAMNIMVEVARLNRPLDSYPFEIPDAHVKYVVFWVMKMALSRDGDGQDLKLAKHFDDRFEMGCRRAELRLRKVQKEFVLRMGSASRITDSFGGMGDPQLPYPYGRSTGRTR